MANADTYQRMREGFEDLVSGTYTDIFVDTNQVFPPRGASRVNTIMGPVYQGYVNIMDYRRLLESENPAECIRAIDYVINFSDRYLSLLSEFSQSNPFFVI